MNYDLLDTCVRFLHIKGRIHITFTDKKNNYAVADHIGLWKGKKLEHHINFYNRNARIDSRSVDTLLAHELIHAWQAENNKGIVSHGADFQLKAHFLTGFLKGNGFHVGTIYNPEIDAEF